MPTGVLGDLRPVIPPRGAELPAELPFDRAPSARPNPYMFLPSGLKSDTLCCKRWPCSLLMLVREKRWFWIASNSARPFWLAVSGAVVLRIVPTESLNASNSVRVGGFVVVEGKFDCRSILRYFGSPSCMCAIFRHARPPDVDFTETMSCEPFLETKL